MGVIFFAVGILPLLGFEIYNSYTYVNGHWQPKGDIISTTYGVIATAVGLVLLIGAWPRIRYQGPKFAIADEGVYLLLAGMHLELLEWSNIDRFDSEVIRSRQGRPIKKILVYPVSIDLFQVRIEEREGKVPLLVQYQFGMHGERSPFHVRVDTMKDEPDLQTLLNHLDLSLAQHRAKVGQS